MKTKIKQFLLIGFFPLLFFLSINIFSQPGHPNGSSGPVHPPPPTPVGGGSPIDDGLNIIIVLAIVYGVKKYFSIQHELKNQE
jgi:hypothetical protein